MPRAVEQAQKSSPCRLRGGRKSGYRLRGEERDWLAAEAGLTRVEGPRRHRGRRAGREVQRGQDLLDDIGLTDGGKDPHGPPQRGHSSTSTWNTRRMSSAHDRRRSRSRAAPPGGAAPGTSDGAANGLVGVPPGTIELWRHGGVLGSGTAPGVVAGAVETAEALTVSGARVTIVEKEREILPFLDVEMAALVRKYQDYAYGVSISVLSDFELSRDVVQESFISAYCDLSKLRDPTRFGGWLRGIVRNIAYRSLRQLKHVRLLTAQLAQTVEEVAPAPSPAKSAQQQEQCQLVQCALQQLGVKNREAVSLHYVDGLSYTDIAAFLDVSEAAVLGRLQRGRRQLRKELKVIEKTFKDNAPDESFARQVAEAIEVYSTKGPAQNHMGGTWEKLLRRQTSHLLGSHKEGFQIAVALSQSDNARIRMQAALHLVLRHDSRGKEHLHRLI